MNKIRNNPIEIEKEEFRRIGYQLIDDISGFISSIDAKPVTYNRSPSQIQQKIAATLPKNGSPAGELLTKTTELLINNSLFNGHPRFLGYITSSATPIGALADLLAAAVNPNVGAHILSPVATEIEKQTIKWLAEFIGVSPKYGGVLVSGGNMANFTAFLAAITAKAPKAYKTKGVRSLTGNPAVYCAKSTHAWIEKAAILFGLGSDAIRWIPCDSANSMKTTALEEKIEEDLNNGCLPIMVVGTAGDVSTGAIDDLTEIGKICQTYDLWYHIDGAYGVPAAVVPQYRGLFNGMEQADSIALDPHKWLYSPLEAGCTLVKDPKHLTDTFSSHPEYYNFGSEEGEFAQNFYEYGLQNSRGFRALKVWLGLQQMGRNGYEKLIREDIQLAELLYMLADEHPQLQAVSQNLSITTFRYVPEEYGSDDNFDEVYLNSLNETLVHALQRGGEVFLSNAIVDQKYCLRGCIVNFRTSEKDIRDIIEIVVREGRKMHLNLQNKK
ncbi:pyridoxal phosphate-dependent decarboxylase family protein [Lentiprolixibacter aurantiacus]|uniref:Aminotransferase class V-fold PLP-dependent enzyme n=1 Tax=Lentiprolixibacter aurantiacus TaxID=2993939 RepID=A0AAE3MP89_9FLAO|nr:aminotransferase class V-fold PLP-dependent enzyme [Lentiprolixibacter aurantiacus]MCX2720489.1 aminotransferase class V-fold PLP-dependent enzyme [Lentiprolixibacter aurantiacus]